MTNKSLKQKSLNLNGDILKKIKGLSKKLDGADREISEVEELNRYEAIMDYFIVQTVDKETQEIVITSPGLLSDKNSKHILKVLDELDCFEFSETNEYSKRIFAKANYLREKINFYKRGLTHPLSAIASYVQLESILRKENKR